MDSNILHGLISFYVLYYSDLRANMLKRIQKREIMGTGSLVEVKEEKYYPKCN